jgi:hypothetical protein
VIVEERAIDDTSIRAVRCTTAGFYGALTQAFRDAHPPIAGTIAAMIILPIVTHLLEFLSKHIVNVEVPATSTCAVDDISSGTRTPLMRP